jgi:hydrogenase maturation factor
MLTGEAFWLDKPAVLPAGKLPQDFLDELLGRFVRKDKRVLVNAGIGRDAAVIDFGDKLLVAKTDPITFVADDAGWYALQINANDIACMGGEPRWFLATLLFPQGATPTALVEKTFSQISSACKKIGVTLCGGHTEITIGLNRPLITGMMLGETTHEKLMNPEKIQVGDAVVISKGLAIEATSIIAREKQSILEEEYGRQIARRCLKYSEAPGLSVLEEARMATEIEGMHALHDPTEGGLNAALHELAKAAGVGFQVDLDLVPLPTEAKLLCDHFGLDILSIISSGALVACGTEEACQEFVTDCHRRKIAAEIVGRVVEPELGLYYRAGRKRIPVPRPQRDEIIKIF